MFPLKLQTKNNLTAGLVPAICVLLIFIFTSWLDKKPYTDIQEKRPSSFFTDSTGARAIYLILKEFFPSVQQWRKPPKALVFPLEEGFTSTLIINGPTRPISPSNVEALDNWIFRGGQLILASHKPWPIEKMGKNLSDHSTPAKMEADAPPTGDYLSHHGFKVVQIDSESRRQWAPEEFPLDLDGYFLEGQEYEPLLTHEKWVLSGSKAIGKGRLVVVPYNYAFSNETARNFKNVVWLAERCADRGKGEVLIDEYFHGFGEKRGFITLLTLFLHSPWGWVCLQLVLAGLIYLFGYRRPFGRLRHRTPGESPNPLDAIEARGGLLVLARAQLFSIKVFHQYLIHQIGKALGYTANLSDKDIREQIAAKSGFPESQIQRYLALVDEAVKGRKISREEFMEIAQKAAQIQRSFRHDLDFRRRSVFFR